MEADIFTQDLGKCSLDDMQKLLEGPSCVGLYCTVPPQGYLPFGPPDDVGT